jgi:hypothetical protein
MAGEGRPETPREVRRPGDRAGTRRCVPPAGAANGVRRVGGERIQRREGGSAGHGGRSTEHRTPTYEGGRFSGLRVGQGIFLLWAHDGVGAENVVRAAQAACWYSCRMPPSRSRRRMSRRSSRRGSMIGWGSGRRGAAAWSARWGRCSL